MSDKGAQQTKIFPRDDEGFLADVQSIAADDEMGTANVLDELREMFARRYPVERGADFERMIWVSAWAVALRNGHLAIEAMREAHRAVGIFRNLVEKDQRVSPAERKFLEGLLGSVPK